MGAEAKRTVEEYRKARDGGDYATQAGILTSLLRTLVEGDEEHEAIARDTAREVLRLRELTA